MKVEVEYEETQENENPGSIVDFGQTENRETDLVRCELIEDDVEKANGHYFVPIVGIESDRFDGIESGKSTLSAEGAVFLDGALHVPQDASIEFGSIDDYIGENDDSGVMRRLQSRQNRRLNTFGRKKVLVVRADAYDRSTSADMATLSNNIFGTGDDRVTLQSQYRKCSHEQLIFAPYDNESGVIEVQLQGNVNSVDKFVVEDAMANAATASLGDLAANFDHVMLCVPPGTGAWLAYAYVGSWLSVFNDDWCQQLSTQVHEIGHNLGLAHSGRGNDDYDDKSGMMGYSFKENDAPKQCFNPAKSYDLGWYADSVVEWNPLTQGTWFGNIVGVVDYDGTETVIVKIPRPENGKHLYIGYNRKKQFNSGVVDEGDRVVIVEQRRGYEVSRFVEGLHARSSVSKKTFYNFEDSGKNLVVDFSGYNEIGGDSIGKAYVAIYFDDCIYPSCCTGELCDQRQVSFIMILVHQNCIAIPSKPD